MTELAKIITDLPRSSKYDVRFKLGETRDMCIELDRWRNQQFAVNFIGCVICGKWERKYSPFPLIISPWLPHMARCYSCTEDGKRLCLVSYLPMRRGQSCQTGYPADGWRKMLLLGGWIDNADICWYIKIWFVSQFTHRCSSIV